MHRNPLITTTLLLAVLLNACTQVATPALVPSSTSPGPASQLSAPPLPEGLLESISLESLMGYVEHLAGIEPHSGWRNSATEGEAEALAYVEEQLAGLDFLLSLGMAVERQTFHVYNATEIWETRLVLSVDGRETEIPVDAIRGNRDENAWAVRFDSDGRLGDTARNPITVAGPVAVVRSHDELETIDPVEIRDRVVFLDYAAIDSFALGSPQADVSAGVDLLALHPAAIVLVTQDSDEPGESHGTFVADSNPLTRVPISAEAPAIPILYARLEDMSPAAVQDWGDLEDVGQAALTWDADVLSPGLSGNRIAHIPGRDTSQAVILGAHIDSPNCPGALDDGSGSAILLEVARVLDAAQVQPPSDVYLAWFGSEELGLYGSSYFAVTHQELLDRTLGMLQIDMLSRPLDGIGAEITLVGWSYRQLGAGQLPWLEHLSDRAEAEGITAWTYDTQTIYSDNSVLTGFDVPNGDMIYVGPDMERYGAVHYAAHIHDPYDTPDQVAEFGQVFVDMARLALLAVFEGGREEVAFRVTPLAEHRVVFVGSHTEAPWMTPVGLIELGQTLAMAGYDVDLVPFGHPVTAQDLEGADFVVALPVVDYADDEGDDDQAWTEAEITTLERYVAQGGLLVLTNSAHRLKFYIRPWEANEDWIDMNALAEPFGIEYGDTPIGGETAPPERGVHPLVDQVPILAWVADNGLAFTLGEGGLVLARASGQTVAGLASYGEASGEILVLADVGLLGGTGESGNMIFWQNLARYALTRN